MEFFICLIAIAIIIYMFIAISNLNSKVSSLLSEINYLKFEIKELKKPVAPGLQQIENSIKPVEKPIVEQPKPTPPIDVQPVMAPSIFAGKNELDVIKVAAIESVSKIEIPTIETIVNEPILVQKPQQNSKQEDSVWSKLEKQFIDNWTGILGTAIMVLGVGFLSIYTAIKLSEVYRFAILLAYASLLVGAYFWLRNKVQWAKMSLWLRSAGAALYLFSCLGAGYIDGLKFIQSPITALVVLNIGIAVNLLLAYVGGNQVFASVHVAISLIALSVLPQASISELYIGGIIALFGIALTYQNKWEYHLLASISLFFAYHLLWYYHHHGNMSMFENYSAIAIVAAVSISAMLVHYGKAYDNVKFEILPFIVHIVNWSYLATGLMLHSTGNKWKTIILIVAALASYFLSRRAKQKNIEWLYYSDAIISTIILFVALFTLNNWYVDNAIIVSLMLFTALLFQFMVHQQNEKLLFKYITVVSQGFAMAALIIFGQIGLINNWENVLPSKIVLALFVAVSLGVYHVYQLTKSKTDFKDAVFSLQEIPISISGILSGVFAIQFLILATDVPFIYTIASALAIIFLLLNKKFNSIEFAINSLALMIATIVLFIIQNSQHQYTITQQWLYATIVYMPLLVSIAFSYVKTIGAHFKWLGIYFIVGFTIYLIYSSVHNTYYISYSFMVLAVVILAMATFIHKKIKSELIEQNVIMHLLICGYVAIGLMLISFVPNYLQQNQFTHRNYNFLIISSLASVALLLYFMLVNTLQFTSQRLIAFKKINHAFFELTVALVYLIISKEILIQYHPIILLSGSLLIIYTKQNKIIQPRLIAYLSILPAVAILQFFYTASQLHLPIYTETVNWIVCFTTLILFFCYALYTHLKIENKVLLAVSKLLFALAISYVIMLYVNEIWQAFYWIVLAFISILIYQKLRLKEFILYTLAYYLITAFSVAFLSSQYINVSTSFLSTASLVSIVVQLAMVGLVYLLYKWISNSDTEQVDIYKLIFNQKNAVIIYPLTFSIAIFLFFGYEKSVLTLLWVVECFVLFGLSLVLGEKQFRLISLVSLLACIVRLFFYDLSRTNTITKALVFLGVGIIMIAINSLHNKFKERYHNKSNPDL